MAMVISLGAWALPVAGTHLEVVSWPDGVAPSPGFRFLFLG